MAPFFPPPMLKIDFHTHTAEDPQDRIRYSARDLIDRAGRLGFDALAVTNHNALTYGDDLRAYAESKGLLLLPGTELTVEGCHILVINPRFPVAPDIRYRLAEISGLKTPDSLFIAPHPFFSIFQSLRSRLYPLLPEFDAIEFASYYNRVVDFNAKAVRLAAEAGKPWSGPRTATRLGSSAAPMPSSMPIKPWPPSSARSRPGDWNIGPARFPS